MAQSMLAIEYTNPRFIGIYVKSVAQAAAVWFLLGRFIAAPFSGDYLAHQSRFFTYARVLSSGVTSARAECAVNLSLISDHSCLKSVHTPGMPSTRQNYRQRMSTVAACRHDSGRQRARE